MPNWCWLTPVKIIVKNAAQRMCSVEMCGPERVSKQQTLTFCHAACCWCQQQNGNMLFLMQIQPLWCRSAPLFFHLFFPLSAIVCPSEFALDSLGLSVPRTHMDQHTYTYHSFLRAVSDSGMKSISEPAPSHHPSSAPIFSHHEARPLLCQPKNKPHHPQPIASIPIPESFSSVHL